MESVGTWYWYSGFALLVSLAVVVDLLVLGNKKDEPVSFRQALVWSMLWVALALVFNALLWWYLDGK